MARVVDYLGSDLDQLLLYTAQTPVAHALGQWARPKSAKRLCPALTSVLVSRLAALRKPSVEPDHSPERQFPVAAAQSRGVAPEGEEPERTPEFHQADEADS